MPETPKTTLRIPRALMDASKAKARAEGTTVTAIVVARLTEYVAGDGSRDSAGQSDAVSGSSAGSVDTVQHTR